MSWVWRLIAFLYMVVIMLYNAVNVLFHSRRSLRAPKTAVRHQVGFSSGVKVSEVKELRRLIGTSFNDILVSCAASAIERHLLECDQLKDARTLFMIPTSLRADADFTLSNQVRRGGVGGQHPPDPRQSSAFTLSVPIGVDPIDRLRTVSRRMHRQKATWEPEILYVLGRFVCRWPAMFATTARLAQLFNEVIVTNVPGPASSDALLIGGLRIVAMTPIVCLAHQNTIGIGFLSFGDEIRFSVHMKLDEGGDGQAVYRRHSAQNIADALAKAFRELRDRIRSSDGSRQAT